MKGAGMASQKQPQPQRYRGTPFWTVYNGLSQAIDYGTYRTELFRSSSVQIAHASDPVRMAHAMKLAVALVAKHVATIGASGFSMR